ncbi:hypothetical protein [Shimazuella alba]|uniref:Uncharacterized protein n=1 Tax=Shimazuella alba TaxID=2690964 RepID=A0A6I4VLC4_9BACL|nr:hypothetical protein [Shimazuella alba]MXQ52389.1 hypothetical protein [Shimazuella alba]
MGKKTTEINVVFTNDDLDEFLATGWTGKKAKEMWWNHIITPDGKKKLRFHFSYKNNHNILVDQCPVDDDFSQATTSSVRPGESKNFSGVMVINQCRLP